MNTLSHSDDTSNPVTVIAPIFTEAQRAACEVLIMQARMAMGLPRHIAILAIGIRDMKRLQQGLDTQIPGVNFQSDFAHEPTDPMLESLHEDDAAMVVCYLEGVELVEAKRRVRERIDTGVWTSESKH